MKNISRMTSIWLGFPHSCRIMITLLTWSSMHKPAPVASCVMYFLVGRDGNWRVTHRRTARACWVRHIDIFFLVCTQISGWNVIWLNSCSLHHYESRFAGNVRKAHLSIFWKVPQGFLFRTACVAHWPVQIQNMFPKKVLISFLLGRMCQGTTRCRFFALCAMISSLRDHHDQLQ